MKVFIKSCSLSAFLFCFFGGFYLNAASLNLAQAIALAIEQDPWLIGNQHQQASVMAMQNSIARLPNPQVGLKLANLPTDSFDRHQEPMSQLSLTVSQAFLRGDSAELSQQMYADLAKQYPYLAQDRQAQIALNVSQLWLELYQTEQNIELVKQSQTLFEQLADIVQHNYASAYKTSRQDQVLRAELENTRLAQKLIEFNQQKQSLIQRLAQYVPLVQLESANFKQKPSIHVIQQNPNPSPSQNEQAVPVSMMSHYLYRHPLVLALNQKIAAGDSQIKLAEQSYKAQWSVNASYGYRADDMQGNNRADLLSIGVNFDLPLFNRSEQDQQVKAKVQQTEAIKTDKLLLIRQLLADYASTLAQYENLQLSIDLYQHKLLPQIEQQAQAALNAYTHNSVDFAEVVRSKIDLLTAQTELLAISVKQLKAITRLNYYFAGERLTSAQVYPTPLFPESVEVQ